MAASQGVIAAIDRVIEYFNARRMDLPDGFFDRKTQFLVNGASFESLLSAAPNDPLVLMLARGPAGFRFAAKALQHAMPDASIHLTPSSIESGSLSTGAPGVLAFQLRLSGTLRGAGEAVNALVEITLRMAPAGPVEIAEAIIDPATLAKIKAARVSPG
jgi:hypothetical protein